MARRAGIYYAERTKELLALLTPETAQKGVSTAMKRLAPLLWKEVAARTPASKRVALPNGKTYGGTGNLRRSWAASPHPTAVALGNTAAYAGFVEDGTRPHVIRPKNGKALVWRTNGRGPVSAAKSGNASQWKNFIARRAVNHPGTKPQRIVPKTLKAITVQMGTTVLGAITEAFRGQTRNS